MAAEANHDPGEIDLVIVPRICILSENSPDCFEQITISWSMENARSVCLFAVDKVIPVACWEGADSGDVQIELNTEESVNFELRDYENTLIVLATAEFKVVHDKKKYRRSRRNPWSFF